MDPFIRHIAFKIGECPVKVDAKLLKLHFPKLKLISLVQEVRTDKYDWDDDSRLMIKPLPEELQNQIKDGNEEVDKYLPDLDKMRTKDWNPQVQFMVLYCPRIMRRSPIACH